MTKLWIGGKLREVDDDVADEREDLMGRRLERVESRKGQT